MNNQKTESWRRFVLNYDDAKITFPDGQSSFQKGKHPPLITKEMYWQNQELLKMKNKDYLIGLKHYNKNVMAPLSKFIKCINCHEIMTRTNPDGIFRYYCGRKTCRGTGSVIAEEAHAEFEDVLTRITPKPNTLKLMKEILVRTSLKELVNINQDLVELRDKLNEMATTRSNTIKKYVNGQINEEDKQLVIDELDTEKLDVTEEINVLEQQQSVSEANIEYALNFMANIAKQWSDASLDLKQKFQSLIFPEGFEYDISNHKFIINKISPLYGVITPEIEADYATNSVMVTYAENSCAAPCGHARCKHLRVTLVFERRLPSTSWLSQSKLNHSGGSHEKSPS